jgi:hypothetical protein
MDNGHGGRAGWAELKLRKQQQHLGSNRGLMVISRLKIIYYQLEDLEEMID